jgi:hypothetical protein
MADIDIINEIFSKADKKLQNSGNRKNVKPT